MNLDIADFSSVQRQALLDLLVLAQYLDRHLGTGEDEHLKRLLVAMGCETPFDRQRTLDAAVTRVRPYAETLDTACAHGIKLGQAFTTRDQCAKVFASLEDLIRCDGRVEAPEKQFLDALRDRFQV